MVIEQELLQKGAESGLRKSSPLKVAVRARLNEDVIEELDEVEKSPTGLSVASKLSVSTKRIGSDKTQHPLDEETRRMLQVLKKIRDTKV